MVVAVKNNKNETHQKNRYNPLECRINFIILTLGIYFIL